MSLFCIGPGLCAIHPTSWNMNFANFAFWAFSEVAHSPGPIQQVVLCRVSEGPSLMYIRLR